MTSTSPAAASQPYMIRCAEIWGGTSVKEDQLATPGLHAAIHSSASGDSGVETCITPASARTTR